MVDYDDLGSEVKITRGELVLGVRGDVATLDIFDGHVVDVKADIIAGDSLGQGLMVHLNRLNLSGKVNGDEGENHAGLDHSGLNTANAS